MAHPIRERGGVAALLEVRQTESLVTTAIATIPQIRQQIEQTLVIAGALSIVFGILLVAYPAAGALAMVWLIGAYALIFGIKRAF